MRSQKHTVRNILCGVALVLLSFSGMADEHCKEETFTTAALADYVLGCMSANGNSYESLHQCSCSIDFIKSKMTYDEYVEAQTVLQARRDKGQRGIFYRDSSWAKQRVKDFQKIQAESTLRCF